MLGKGFDKPVINLHELAHGIEKYHNSDLGINVLGRSPNSAKNIYNLSKGGMDALRAQQDPTYSQSLDEITALLRTDTHYITSRLSHYHMLNRNDDVKEQADFYKFLNENFYIISCRRDNMFEHALSWIIFNHTKKLNVYSPIEKVEVCQDIYSNGIKGFKEQIDFYLDRYLKYIDWVDNNFNIQSYFYYDRDLNNIEDYILNLEFMKTGNTGPKWETMFNQSFSDYNTCSRVLPNLLLHNQSSKNFQLSTSQENFHINYLTATKEEYELHAGSDWPSYEEFISGSKKVSSQISTEIATTFKENNYQLQMNEKTYNFLQKNINQYKNTFDTLEELVEKRYIPRNVPVKLQTMDEKSKIIRNFDQCVEWYNEWVDSRKVGKKYSVDDIAKISLDEETQWESQINLLLK